MASAGEIAAREVYTLADLRDWPAATVHAGPPLRLAVLGDPIAHSASPPMHNAALMAANIAARYTRLHIRPDELADALRLMIRAGFIGCNLTLPHKVAVLPLLDQVDAHAAALGAVNTVRVQGDGRLQGFNTDGPGFGQAVRADFGVDLRDLRVLILGAGGGAGRALAAQCALAGCPRLKLVNRTVEKIHALAETLQGRCANPAQISVLAWETSIVATALEDVDLVVNASTVGLKTGGRFAVGGHGHFAPVARVRHRLSCRWSSHAAGCRCPCQRGKGHGRQVHAAAPGRAGLRALVCASGPARNHAAGARAGFPV